MERNGQKWKQRWWWWYYHWNLIIVLLIRQYKAAAAQGHHFNIFLGGPTFFYIFQCHRTIEKLEKQHFICSNLTLFIVPFFLFFLFFSLFFLFFLFFFLFFFFLFPWGATAPQPPIWRLCSSSSIINSIINSMFMVRSPKNLSCAYSKFKTIYAIRGSSIGDGI